jgi:hypothetical protein
VPDLVVAHHVFVELKSVKNLIPEHEAQLLNYMRVTRKPVGYLVNFAPIDKIEWKRFVLSQFHEPTERGDLSDGTKLAHISVH